jgi:hypothetical protein
MIEMIGRALQFFGCFEHVVVYHSVLLTATALRTGGLGTRKISHSTYMLAMMLKQIIE